MSFTTNIKNEISKENVDMIASRAELSAILRNSYNKTTNSLDLVLENSTVCKHIYSLFKELYNVNIKTEYKTTKFSKNRLYTLVVPNNEEILKDLSVIDDNNNYLSVPKSYITFCEDEKRAYLKGLFLVAGSINDPKTSMYHLEFFIDYFEEASFVLNLLNEFYLNSKMIERDKGYMVYIKEAEKIGDFLRIMGAINSLFYFEDIRIYKDHKNMVNRLNNCEQANVEKSLKSSKLVLDNIKYLEDNDLINLLDDRAKEIISYKKKVPRYIDGGAC